MPDPVVAQSSPYAVELAPGDYWWCACGRSKRQPFCDGSHKGTEFTPLETKVEERKSYALCQCKRTATVPWCDGSHAKP